MKEIDPEISTVRSIKDSNGWREDQLVRVHTGGNKACNEFLMNDYDLYKDANDKYSCVLACKWREKIMEDSGIEKIWNTAKESL